MVKKLKAMAEKQAAAAAQMLDSQLASSIRDSAHQIWLAGLGAFSKAQGQGNSVFETLVSQGLQLQKKTQDMAEDAVSAVSGKMTAMAQEVGGKANASWDKLESIFEQRTAKAIGRLGVPTAADLSDLSQRLAALETAVAKLATKPAAVKTPSREAAAKPSRKADAAPAKAATKAPKRKPASRKPKAGGSLTSPTRF